MVCEVQANSVGRGSVTDLYFVRMMHANEQLATPNSFIILWKTVAYMWQLPLVKLRQANACNTRIDVRFFGNALLLYSKAVQFDH